VCLLSKLEGINNQEERASKKNGTAQFAEHKYGAEKEMLMLKAGCVFKAPPPEK